MAVNRSYIVAGAATLAIIGWFAVNSAGSSVDVYEDTGTQAQAETVMPTVVVRPSTAQTYSVRLETYGRTQPHRSVEVKAKTAASVSATPVEEGALVKRGQVICRQDVDSRRAVVAQAQAAVAKAEADLAATEALVERGFKSAASLNTDRANLDAVRAQLSQARNELDNIIMRAPFAGVFDARMAEVGDYLAPGQACGMVVELDPLLVEAELTETQLGTVALGQPVDVTLATGQSVDGLVSFIESRANPSTRTFRVEAEIPNPDLTLKAGVSATIGLQTGEVDAHRVPAGILALDDNGNMGVRYLERDNVVRFASVDVVDETPEGVWVTGLPANVRVIIEGQDYVSQDAQVNARTEGGAQLSPTSPVADVPGRDTRTKTTGG